MHTINFFTIMNSVMKPKKTEITEKLREEINKVVSKSWIQTLSCNQGGHPPLLPTLEIILALFFLRPVATNNRSRMLEVHSKLVAFG